MIANIKKLFNVGLLIRVVIVLIGLIIILTYSFKLYFTITKDQIKEFGNGVSIDEYFKNINDEYIVQNWIYKTNLNYDGSLTDYDFTNIKNVLSKDFNNYMNKEMYFYSFQLSNQMYPYVSCVPTSFSMLLKNVYSLNIVSDDIVIGMKNDPFIIEKIENNGMSHILKDNTYFQYSTYVAYYINNMLGIDIKVKYVNEEEMNELFKKNQPFLTSTYLPSIIKNNTKKGGHMIYVAGKIDRYIRIYDPFGSIYIDYGNKNCRRKGEDVLVLEAFFMNILKTFKINSDKEVYFRIIY
jgi:hypothetical protein